MLEMLAQVKATKRSSTRRLVMGDCCGISKGYIWMLTNINQVGVTKS